MESTCPNLISAEPQSKCGIKQDEAPYALPCEERDVQTTGLNPTIGSRRGTVHVSVHIATLRLPKGWELLLATVGAIFSETDTFFPLWLCLPLRLYTTSLLFLRGRKREEEGGRALETLPREDEDACCFVWSLLCVSE